LVAIEITGTWIKSLKANFLEANYLYLHKHTMREAQAMNFKDFDAIQTGLLSCF